MSDKRKGGELRKWEVFYNEFDSGEVLPIIIGMIYNDEVHGDDREIITSPIINVDYKNHTIETENTIYTFKPPTPEELKNEILESYSKIVEFFDKLSETVDDEDDDDGLQNYSTEDFLN